MNRSKRLKLLLQVLHWNGLACYNAKDRLNSENEKGGLNNAKCGLENAKWGLNNAKWGLNNARFGLKTQNYLMPYLMV